MSSSKIDAYFILEHISKEQPTEAIFRKSSLKTIFKSSENEQINEQKIIPPDTSDWVDAFKKIKPIDSVTSITIDLSFINWDQNVLDLSTTKFPNLLKLELFINPNKQKSITLNFPKLAELELKIDKKNKDNILELKGHLPNLTNLRLTYFGLGKINARELAALLLSSTKLSNIKIFYRYGWLLAEEIAKALHQNSPTIKPYFVVHQPENYNTLSLYYSDEKDDLDSKNWQAFSILRKFNFEIDLISILPLVNCLERFDQAKESLQSATNLLLDGDYHSFLIKEPELLKGFDKLEDLEIFGANELTRKGFVWLTTQLPNLKKLRLTNNHNPEFSVLDLQSQTLTSLVLTHFHRLESYQINCPSLQTLELDNCTEEDYPADKDIRWCNGNFGERFLRDLLDGQTNLPELKNLYIWHNHNGFGPPIVIEQLRLDISCNVGHQKLEEMGIVRHSHIRSLTLKNLPNLKQLSILDDFEEGEGWLEKLDISNINAECEVKINCLSNQPKIGK